ncbi:hypothetical protein ACWCQQ_31705 [Streptomyces sp. NPDC002143]
MTPDQAGISDSDWSKVVELGDYNGAYTEFIDNTGDAILVFTGGNVPDGLEYPSDFTGFDDPDLLLWGEYSQFASNADVAEIIDSSVHQLQLAGYAAASSYNPDLDVVDVYTEAPSSATNPVFAQYGSKINIIYGNPEAQQGSGGTSPGRHTAPKHPRKDSPQKHTTNKHAPAKKSPQPPAKVVLTLTKP